MQGDDPRINEAVRLIDDMLAAQTRLAQSWSDSVKGLSPQQLMDEQIRDTAKAKLLAMIDSPKKDTDR